MRTGLLLGSHHTELGEIATLAEGRAALALSRGGAAKTYSYRDPNEDACAFAYTADAWLVAVADGHWGAGGAALALQRILDHHAPRWLAPPGITSIGLDARWVDEAPDVLADLNHTLLAEASEDLIGRTTLSLGLRLGDGPLMLLAAGDSHVFAVESSGAREQCPLSGGDRALYLGDPSHDRHTLRAGARAEVVPAAPEALLLATDGLSEPGIGVDDPADSAAAAIAAARRAETEIDLRPLAAARGLTQRALEAHRRQRAGDNVAAACFWCG